MNTVPTSIASRRPGACWRRSGRPRRSCPNARARNTSPPTIPVRVAGRRHHRAREPGGANSQVSEGWRWPPPPGNFLSPALQGPPRQDGGASPETRRYSRLVYYDVADREHPRLVREYVVPLPLFETADGERRVA